MQHYSAQVDRDENRHVSFREPRMAASPSNGVVIVVDEDEAVRKAIKGLLLQHGMAVRTFGSAAELLADDMPDQPCCVVLEIRLPDVNGLELQSRLDRARDGRPIIFLCDYADIPTSVKAMRAGAVDFLMKPFVADDLLFAISTALALSQTVREQRQAIAALTEKAKSLSPREREVAKLVASGLLNKQVAFVLGLSEVTVKAHRGKALRKLNIRSLPDLVRVAESMWRDGGD